MPLKTKGFHRIYALFVLPMLIASLLFSACAESEEFEGEGDILDSPIGVAVYGQYAYVTNANYDLSGDGDGWVAVIDLEMALRDWKSAIITRLFTDPYLGDILINKDGTFGYVTNRERDLVMVMDMSDPVSPEWIDLDPDKDGTQGITVGYEPVGLAFSPDESTIYVANLGSGEVSLIDTESRQVIKNIDLGWGVHNIAVDPQGKYAYVTNRGYDTLAMIDIETENLVASFSIGDRTTGLGYETRGINFSEDGRYAYIANRQPPALLVLDTEKLPNYPANAIVEYISMGSAPSGIALTPDGKEIWVANYGSKNVYVVDASTLAVTDVIVVGVGPYNIAMSESSVDPGHYYAVVTNFEQHNVALVDVKYKELIWTIE